MIEDRIAEVRVRVRTDVEDAGEIRPTAERMVRATLERCAEILEMRAPGRVVIIRRLPLRWRFEESFFDDAQVEELARSVADAIERMAGPSLVDSSGRPDAAVLFDDEPHLRASHLLALARGEAPWFHAVLSESDAESDGGSNISDALAFLAAPERRVTALATLVRLARDGVLAEVFAAVPASAIAVFAAALISHAPAIPVSKSVMSRSPIVSELAAIASQWPALPRTARLLALRIHAAVLLDDEVESPAVIALADEALHVISHNPVQKSIDQQPEPLKPPTVAGHETVEIREPAVRSDSAPETVEHIVPINTAALIATRCAGLFYLLDRVQELDLAESIWKSCLSEGAVLAAAMTALLGKPFAHDPAPLLFGGVESAACPKVLPEQQAEVAVATCAALAAALPRRGLASMPAASLSLVDRPEGRLLVAAAEDSPFVFFAWPAPAPAAIDLGLRALLSVWPHQSVLTAAPALATLDTTGRLQPRHEPRPRPLFIPKAGSAAAAALLAIVAGAPSVLFAARCGPPLPNSVEEFVAAHLARAGHIRLSSERMDVTLGAEDVDFDARHFAARQGGLDRDPGWLPWLRRTVRFVFEEHDLAATEARE